MFEVQLKGVKVFGFHGVNPEETRDGQHFLVDLCATVDRALPETDDLELTLNYAKLNKLIIREVEGGPYQLIETLLKRIGQAVLDEFPACTAADVTVHKPQAPIKGVFDDVAVRALFRR